MSLSYNTRVSNMSEEDKLFLLRDLNKIEQMILEKEYIPKFPFIEIFKMHKERKSNKYIARKLKIEHYDVNAIIHGAITIPRPLIKKVENLGFTICYRCRKRIVPIEPVGYCILTRLCKICYRRGAETEYNIPNDIKLT